jgi:hypothetical protein
MVTAVFRLVSEDPDSRTESVQLFYEEGGMGNELTDDEKFNEITGNADFGDMMVAIDRVDLATWSQERVQDD